MEKALGTAKRALVEAGAIIREAAHDATYDLRDTALRGFGVPKFISTVASFSVAGVAALGTASMTLDLFTKVYAPRECNTCNGWEGLRCTTCGGAGKVQYTVSGLSKTEKASVENIASAVVDGREEIIHFHSGFNTGLPLPHKECPTCNGTGVMRCTECKGVALKCKFSLDHIMNVPWKTWDVYQKTKPPLEGIRESMHDPVTAAFWMFGRSELEGGFKYDNDVKEKMMSMYKESRRYEEVRELVAKRKPGWEQLQKALYTIDPKRASRDPIIIKDVPYYKARKQVEAEVAMLEVPPRPAEWTEKYELPLKQSHWTDEELKDPRKSEEKKILLEAQEKLLDRYLNTAWEIKWRQQKVDEIVQEKIQPYMEALQRGTVMLKEKQSTQTAAQTTVRGEEVMPGKPSKGVKGKSAPQKGDKPLSAEEKKKRDRQERTERMAKQSAEREAALVKAKTGSK